MVATATVKASPRHNTMAHISVIAERHRTQDTVNAHLSPRPTEERANQLKLDVWRWLLAQYDNDVVLRKSTAFSEWFSANWQAHNLEIITAVLPIITPIDFGNYGYYQRMKFQKIYPNEAVLTAARREYFDSVEMTVSA